MPREGPACSQTDGRGMKVIQIVTDRKDLKTFCVGLQKKHGPQEYCVALFSFSANGQILLTDKFDILKQRKGQLETALLNFPTVINDEVMCHPQQAGIPELSLESIFLLVINPVKHISSSKVPGKDIDPPEICKYGGQNYRPLPKNLAG